jgi:hypothetical protein
MLQKGAIIMDRKKQRENRKLKKAEERLDIRNAFGFCDYTPYHAVNKMMRNKNDAQAAETASRSQG